MVVVECGWCVVLDVRGWDEKGNDEEQVEDGGEGATPKKCGEEAGEAAAGRGNEDVGGKGRRRVATVCAGPPQCLSGGVWVVSE